jgi:hypothetical protein
MESVFQIWLNEHKVLKFILKSKIGKMGLICIGIFMLLCVLHILGVPIEPLELLHNIFSLLTKLT